MYTAHWWCPRPSVLTQIMPSRVCVTVAGEFICQAFHAPVCSCQTFVDKLKVKESVALLVPPAKIS